MSQRVLSPLTEYPSEVLYNILLNLSYPDILKYCSTNQRAKAICDDIYFWMIKLNHDFKIITPNGREYLPSQYVQKYPHSDTKGYDIYKRWNAFRDADPYTSRNIQLQNGNFDILVFYIDINQDDTSLQYLIINSAVANNHISVLNHIIDINLSSPFLELFILLIIDLAIQHNTPHILDWLNHKVNLKSKLDTTTLTKIANDVIIHHPQNINILDWLETQAILPTPDMATYAAHNNLINILNWLEHRAILPSLDHHFNENNDILPNTVQWLQQRNLLPQPPPPPPPQPIRSKSPTIPPPAPTSPIRSEAPIGQMLPPAPRSPTYQIQSLIRSESPIGQMLPPAPRSPTYQIQSPIRSESPIGQMLPPAPRSPTYQIQSLIRSESPIGQMLPSEPRSPIGQMLPPAPRSPTYQIQSLIRSESPIGQMLQPRSPIGQVQASRSPAYQVAQLSPTRKHISMGGAINLEQFKPDDRSKVLNPETGHWVIRGKKIYNDLVKRGVITPYFK